MVYGDTTAGIGSICVGCKVVGCRSPDPDWSIFGGACVRTSRAEPSLNLPVVSAFFTAKVQRGRVAGLPVYHVDPRQTKKSRAGSVKASGLQAWLSSAEGLEWQAIERRRHGQA